MTAKKPPNPDYPKELATLGNHIRKKRLDLGLTQKKVAAILRVTEETINGWEVGRFSPKASYLPRIIKFLGYTPSQYNVAGSNLIEAMKIYRITHGMSQEKFAKLLSTDKKSVSQWELGNRTPSLKYAEKISGLIS